MNKRFYVTTPLYYVNASPHIGHAYTTLLADVLARYHRWAGHDTYFLTGTDEHGQKMADVARREGLSPQALVDRNVQYFRQLWQRLYFTNDDFLRTTEGRHQEIVQNILAQLHESGDIYRSRYDGYYCVNREMYFTEKDISEGRCPECNCNGGVVEVSESNYFFRMSRYSDWLIDYIEENPEFIRPESRRNETLAFLKRGVHDLCISRPKSRLSWGIELPFDADYVTYVWVDALANYISALGYSTEDDERFRRWWPASCHLIGKDILVTHTVYWTTLLKALGLPMPHGFFAHGWWLTSDRKMSKSLGNIVDPLDLLEVHNADVFRYYLVAEMVPGRDASFSAESFIRRHNADLANDLGNTLSRLLKLVHKYCDSKIPAPGELSEEEEALRETVLAVVQGVMPHVERLRVDLVTKSVLGGLRETNRYLTASQPWVLAKNEDKTQFHTCVYVALEAVRMLSAALHPVMPKKVAELFEMLGIGGDPPRLRDLQTWGGLREGAVIPALRSLFPRIEHKRPAAKRLPSVENSSETIGLDVLKRVHLVAARILRAEPVAGFTKLLRLELDLGGSQRQIVSGLAGHYQPDELVGRLIVLVENLKPRRIGGVESNGMLLAGVDGNKISPLTLMDNVAPGSKVM